MDNIKIVATTEDSNLRLDAFLGNKCDDLSRSYAAKLIEDGSVFLNDKPETSKKYKLKVGDAVSVNIPKAEELDVSAENIPLDIKYEDGYLLVVNKPKGMVVHPGNGNYTGTLVNALMYHCKDSLSSINGVIRPGIVHRIDKDTSGLLMIAKTDKAHESLAKQLEEHSVTREYTALVYGNIKEDELTINEPIGRDEKNRLRRAVNGATPKEAITHIKIEKRFGDYTLIKARLETGRTHQIRVHMAYIKHPLVGDELYGPKKQANKLMGVALNGQLLHAGILGFKHPISNEYMEFKAPLPNDFETILEKLKEI